MPTFDPYAAPKTQAAAPMPARGPWGARAEGKNLVVDKTANLPDVCVKCAAREPILRRIKKYVFIPWYGRLFGVVGMLLTRKQATLAIPICTPCNTRYRNAVALMWGVSIATPLLLLAGAVAYAASGELDPDSPIWVLGGVAAVLVPLVVFFVVARSRMLPLAVKIDDRAITLSNVAPAAIEPILVAAGASANAAPPAGWT